MAGREVIAPAADAVADRLAEGRAVLDAEQAAAGEDAPYGLLGGALGHSWSPRIHRALGSVPYALHALPDPADAADLVRNGSWRGLNVTIPHKRLAAEAADVRTPFVEAHGAANTLVRLDDGRILADNTDVWGFDFLLDGFLRRHMGADASWLRGRKAVVLGTGGASEAVRFVLSEAGAEVARISRSGGPGQGYGTLVEDHGDAALLVNTTPVGMYPACPASPLPAGALGAMRGLRGVVDVVYNPLRTGLVLDARDAGIPAEGGLAMLVAQALRSSELWQGVELDRDLVGRIVGELERESMNVFFIGMPGCGKTGAARRLARMAQRPFVDLDDAFEMEYGETPAACISRDGEAAFRDRETAVLAAHGAKTGLVVACGGGLVTRPVNRRLMEQNGTVVMLDRPLDQLSRNDRPLTASRGVEALAAERMPLYREWADIEVRCTGSAEGDAVLVRSLLGL